MSASEADDDCDVMVIDNGSRNIRAGLAGDKTCRSYFPNVVGHLCHSSSHTQGTGSRKAKCIGAEALTGASSMTVTSPMEGGVVADWDAMEDVWRFAFRDLSVTPKECAVLITEVPLNPTANREKMAQVMFESLNTPALFVANPAVLALYASGRTTGTVFDSGHVVSHAVSVFDGNILSESVVRQDFGGSDVGRYLATLLAEHGHSFATCTTAEWEALLTLKRSCAFVSVDDGSEVNMSSSAEESFSLPDGRSIVVGAERCRCTEVLFQPSLLGLTLGGVHRLLFDSIIKSDNVQPSILQNVLLAGANCMYRGFANRMDMEVRSLLHQCGHSEVMDSLKVIAPPERRSSTWLGGSVVGGLSTFHEMSISRSQYDEVGPAVVHQQCTKIVIPH